jgi:protein TonB
VNSVTPILVAPGRTPPRIDMTPDTSAPGPIGDMIPSTTIGSSDGTVGISSISGSRPVMPAAPAPAPTVSHFRTSTILEGNLIRKVQPVYPPLARTARIQGQVILFAMISKAGTIDNLRTISGPPMLVPAAIGAVSQWRYRPYILNGEPIEVETQITVNFTLGGN